PAPALWRRRAAAGTSPCGLAGLALVLLARQPSPGKAAQEKPPRRAAPAVVVATTYPGLPAASVEKDITTRIERWVGQAPGARLVESRSLAGVSVVRVSFAPGADPRAA